MSLVRNIGQKILVVGVSCSGKTTLASKLAAQLNYNHFDLDDFHWLPNWIEQDDEVFKEKIQNEVVPKNNWVVSGAYFSLVKDTLWQDADTIIWLNYPLSVIIKRYAKRTYRRVFLNEVCCNGNYETFHRAFLSNESMLVWILKNHQRRRNQLDDLRRNEFSNKIWIEIEEIKKERQFIN